MGGLGEVGWRSAKEGGKAVGEGVGGRGGIASGVCSTGGVARKGGYRRGGGLQRSLVYADADKKNITPCARPFVVRKI